MAFPDHAKYVVIGAGIHGLSTAYHLALELKARGRGTGADILLLDKGAIASGASGIACGVVRNNYFQPAMRELMAQCVEVWESDMEAYSFHPVGYMQISAESMRDDIGTIFEVLKGIVQSHGIDAFCGKWNICGVRTNEFTMHARFVDQILPVNCLYSVMFFRNVGHLGY